MTILLAVNGWDPQPWLARLRTLLPERQIVTPETIGERKRRARFMGGR